MKFMPTKTQRFALAVGVLLVVALGLPTLAFAAPPSPLVPGSPGAQRISDLFKIVASIALVIFLLVEALILFAVIRFRRKSVDEMPRQVHGNNMLELTWTIIPAGILIGLFVITVPVMNYEWQAPQSGGLTVQVTGRQWQWEFTYPDTGVSTISELRIPAGRPIYLELKSEDVIHSFWVPQLAGKTDVIPGYNNTMWFQADQPGTYTGQCAEFCGLQHYSMLVKVTALSADDFKTWMDQQVYELSHFTPVGTDIHTELPPGDATRGADLYKSQGCSSCHSLNGTQVVGPSFQGLSQRAGTRKPGYTADLYIHESIVQPCAYVVQGFTCVMPQDFGTKKLNKQNLADLIAFLLTQ